MKHRSKKGQLPFVELNGEEIADSTLIIKELSQTFGKDIDAGLTQDQRNVSHAMISMIENKLVWYVLTTSVYDSLLFQLFFIFSFY